MYINYNITHEDKTVQVYITTVFSISIACSILSMLLYILNMWKFRNSKERRKINPLKIKREVFVLNFILACTIWQVLMIAEVHSFQYFDNHEIPHTVFLCFSFFITIIFYSWGYVWQMLMVYTAYYTHFSKFQRRVKISYQYVFVIIVSLFIFGINILSIHLQNKVLKFHEKYVKSEIPFWIITAIEIFMTLFTAVIVYYISYKRFLSIKISTQKPSKEIVTKEILLSDYFRDKVMLLVIFFLIMLTDILYMTKSTSPKTYYIMYGIFHSLWVSLFFQKI